jgi:hypothetical protein
MEVAGTWRIPQQTPQVWMKKPTQSGLWVLLATILASSTVFIDGSALNVALDERA